MFHSHEKATWGLLPPNTHLPFNRASLRSVLVEFALRLPGFDASEEPRSKLQGSSKEKATW
jgi:hypothetical protein